MAKKTVFITGGHPTPAIAVYEELVHRHPEWNYYWVGRKYSFEGHKSVSSEYTLVKDLGIPFLSCVTGRIQRKLSIYTIFSLLKIPLGFVQSIMYILRYRPALILSFGGYVALPMAIAGFLLRVDIVTHEQVMKPGLANAIIGRVAKKILVSFPESKAFFPEEKTVVTGLPIRTGIFTPPNNPSFAVPSGTLPILYITGGSTGAVTLNDALFPYISQSIESLFIIHQTGELSFSKAEDLKKSLGDRGHQYSIQPYFSLSDLSWIYHHADIILGRSGANTVAEVSALNKKAFFIPLPWSGGNEQMENALRYANTGMAVVVDQQSLSVPIITKTIQQLLAVPVRPVERVEHDAKHAPVRIVDVIQSLLDTK